MQISTLMMTQTHSQAHTHTSIHIYTYRHIHTHVYTQHTSERASFIAKERRTASLISGDMISSSSMSSKADRAEGCT